MHVLNLLKSKNGPVSMTDLAEASFISKPNLTTMVDRLCAHGLVERSANPNDRRIVNVSLTQKGTELLDRHREDLVAFIESRLSLLEESDLEKLQLALNELIGILEKIGESPKDSAHSAAGRGECFIEEKTEQAEAGKGSATVNKGPAVTDQQKVNEEKG